MPKENENHANLAAEENSSPVSDIFEDLNKLMITAQEIIPSEKVLTVLPVRKPKRDEWIQTHPTLTAAVNLYIDESDRAVYLVAASALEPMADLVKRVQLTLTQNYEGQSFVWPVAIPAETKSNLWHASGWQAAELARTSWIRVSAGSGAYETYRRPATANPKVPVWPPEVDTVSAMLRFAFGKSGGGEVIQSHDHPVVKKIQGFI